MTGKRNNSPWSAAAKSTLVLLAVFATQGQAQAKDYREIDRDRFNYYLGSPCANGEWRQTGGPPAERLINKGEKSYAKLEFSGTYTFRSTACSAAPTTRTTGAQPKAQPKAPPKIVATDDRISNLMSSPDRVGFGARTTGGSKANKYTVVTNLKDSGSGSLRDALENSGPQWITFSDAIVGGTIYLDSTLKVHSPHVTIDGAGSGITVSVSRSSKFPMFHFRGGNSIVHGITIDGNNSNSTGIMLREGDNYWIDHVTATNFNFDDAISIGRGSVPDTSTSEVTISNLHTYNTNYSLLGGGSNSVNRFPPYRVTIHSSILSAEDRNPRIVNYGTAHIFNSYIHSFRFTGVVAGANSVVYSQNNVYSALSANSPKNALSGNDLGNMAGGGRIGVAVTDGDIFLDVAATRGKVVRRSDTSKRLPYSYSLMPADQVLDYVTANAGAKNAGRTGSPRGGVVQTRKVAAPVAAAESKNTVGVRTIQLVKRNER